LKISLVSERAAALDHFIGAESVDLLQVGAVSEAE
jgi:hypothetical protein